MLARRCGAPPAVVPVHNAHIAVLPGVWGPPAQHDIVPLDRRTSQVERCLSLGGGDVKACGEGAETVNQLDRDRYEDAAAPELCRRFSMKRVNED